MLDAARGQHDVEDAKVGHRDAEIGGVAHVENQLGSLREQVLKGEGRYYAAQRCLKPVMHFGVRILAAGHVGDRVDDRDSARD